MSVERDRAGRHRGGDDERTVGPAVGTEAVEQVLELVDRRDLDPHQEAALTGDLVRLAPRRRVAGKLRDPRNLAGPGWDPHPGRDRPAERGWIDVEPVTANHA